MEYCRYLASAAQSLFTSNNSKGMVRKDTAYAIEMKPGKQKSLLCSFPLVVKGNLQQHATLHLSRIGVETRITTGVVNKNPNLLKSVFSDKEGDPHRTTSSTFTLVRLRREKTMFYSERSWKYYTIFSFLLMTVYRR
jgi:hypothetical protein